MNLCIKRVKSFPVDVEFFFHFIPKIFENNQFFKKYDFKVNFVQLQDSIFINIICRLNYFFLIFSSACD